MSFPIHQVSRLLYFGRPGPAFIKLFKHLLQPVLNNRESMVAQCVPDPAEIAWLYARLSIADREIDEPVITGVI